jgi:DNA-directed RNA polymerase subunit beta'
MGRNMSIVVIDSDDNERAVAACCLRFQAAMLMKVTRSNAVSGWLNGIRTLVRCLTEVDGVVDFEDLVDGASVQETADEATGITKRVVIDWRSSPRGADLKPAIVIKDAKGSVAKNQRGSDARLMLSVDAVLSVRAGCLREGR